MAFENLFKPPHRKRFIAALAAGLIALLVYFSAGHFRTVPGTAALDEPSPAPLTLGIRSIAVMPVPAGPSDFLTPGISIELSRRLGRVRDIEVVAPRSALAAAPGLRAQQPRSLPFGVAWVLEVEAAGQNSGDSERDLRISAGLFEADGAVPVWALERRVSSTGLESFVAAAFSAVLSQLEVEPPAARTAGIELLDEDVEGYLAAGFLQLLGGEALSEAEALLAEIDERKPDSAPVLAALAYTRLLRAAALQSESGRVDAGSDDRVEQARAGLLRAQALAPDLPEGLLYQSLLAYRFDWDWKTAQSAAEAALKRAPGDAGALSAAATAAFTLGDFERGEGQLRRAIALDPLVLHYRLKYGLILEFAGRYQTAIDAYRELMEIDPVFPGGHAYIARALVVAGMAEAALPHAEIEQSAFWKRYGLALVMAALGRNEEADRWLETLMNEHAHEAAVQIAEILAFRGRADEAFGWLERAWEQRDPGLASLVGNALFERLRGDARWAEFLEGLNLKED